MPIARFERMGDIVFEQNPTVPKEYRMSSSDMVVPYLYMTRNELRELRNAITQTLGDHYEVTPESLVAQAGAMSNDQQAKMIHMLVSMFVSKEEKTK